MQETKGVKILYGFVYWRGLAKYFKISCFLTFELNKHMNNKVRKLDDRNIKLLIANFEIKKSEQTRKDYG